MQPLAQAQYYAAVGAQGCYREALLQAQGEREQEMEGDPEHTQWSKNKSRPPAQANEQQRPKRNRPLQTTLAHPDECFPLSV